MAPVKGFCVGLRQVFKVDIDGWYILIRSV